MTHATFKEGAIDSPSCATTAHDASELRRGPGSGTVGNVVMRGMATSAAVLILSVLAAVAIFLLLRAWPSLSETSAVFRQMGGAEDVSIWGLIAPQIFGTLLASALALCIAVPLSIGIALFTSHYVPRSVSGPVSWVVDLLAAVPSVVYGLWGAIWLIPLLAPLWARLSATLGWIPLFAGPASPTGRVILSAAIVLAIMIIPIIASVMREIFIQTPCLHEEAALALGATRWEMIRMAVLPFARSGMMAAAMLGLGRALGETMAVVMILSVGASFTPFLLQAGQHSTIAANIALQFPESTGIDTSSLIATGLALFLITMIVNAAARKIVAGRRDARGVMSRSRHRKEAPA